MRISERLDEQVKAERRKEAAKGTGAAARRARLGVRPARPTHCPQGHAYDDKNTLWTGNGRRMCLACIAARRLYTHGAPPGRYAEHVLIPDDFHARSSDSV